MSLVIRVIITLALFITLIMPLLLSFNDLFGDAIPNLTVISYRLSQFVGVLSSYIANIKGAINYFLYTAGGDIMISVYNALIKLSIMFPVFGLAQKLALGIYYYVL